LGRKIVEVRTGMAQRRDGGRPEQEINAIVLDNGDELILTAYEQDNIGPYVAGQIVKKNRLRNSNI
jgi:hypothetical protein